MEEKIDKIYNLIESAYIDLKNDIRQTESNLRIEMHAVKFELRGEIQETVRNAKDELRGEIQETVRNAKDELRGEIQETVRNAKDELRGEIQEVVRGAEDELRSEFKSGTHTLKEENTKRFDSIDFRLIDMQKDIKKLSEKSKKHTCEINTLKKKRIAR